MKERKLLTPANFHDYLGLKLAHKKEVENIIKNIFLSYGYSRVSSPMLEYIDVFEDIGSIRTKDIFKFIDKDGEILALRSDMTPPIARIVSTNFNKDNLPYRLSYVENIFQSTRNYQGKEKEFTQAGVELIGFNNIESDGEVISMAINSLIESGLEDFKINLGNVKFIRSILSELNLDERKTIKLEKYINDGNFVEVEKFVQKENIVSSEKEILLNLPLLSGGLEVLDKVKYMTKNMTALKALNKLDRLYKVLEDYGLSSYINLDLSMIGHLNYYSGIIFQGYSKSVGYSILSGGRYDNLFEKFGVDLPAVGFAIKINELISALTKQNNIISDKSNVTLIMYDEKSRSVAIKTAEHLRQSGLIVEMSLFGNDFDLNVNYGQTNKLGGILYFKDNKDIDVINLIDGETTKTTLEKLMGVE